MDKEEIRRMRNVSGNVCSDDPLVSFFYVLIRNGCPVHVIEEALFEMTNEKSLYTNGWLAKYSADIAKRFQQKLNHNEHR